MGRRPCAIIRSNNGRTTASNEISASIGAIVANPRVANLILDESRSIHMGRRDRRDRHGRRHSRLRSCEGGMARPLRGRGLDLPRATAKGSTIGSSKISPGFRHSLRSRDSNRHSRSAVDPRIVIDDHSDDVTCSNVHSVSSAAAPADPPRLYGTVLERLFPVDFARGTAHSADTGSSLPEAWPISYEDLRPWYESAERLYRVRGGADPLRPGEETALLPAPPLSAAALRSSARWPGRAYIPIGCTRRASRSTAAAPVRDTSAVRDARTRQPASA